MQETRNSNKKPERGHVPRMKCWRPWRLIDMASVVRLLRPSSRLMFGIFNPERLIELSPHRIVVENADDEITACMCLHQEPNVPRNTWRDIVATNPGCRKLRRSCTLFVHLMVWDQRYDWEWVMHVVRSLYLSVFGLQYVAILVPSGAETQSCFKDRTLAMYFNRVPFGGPVERRPKFDLFVSMRAATLPQLKVRRAVIEDNDDIVAMLERTAPRIRERYGEFFIAELIQEVHRTRDVIVAEHNGTPVGMLSFNTNVNLELLEEMYELRAFNFLQKFAPASPLSGSLSQAEPNGTIDPNAHLLTAGSFARSELNWNLDPDIYTPPSTPTSEARRGAGEEPESTANIRKSVWHDMRSQRLSSCSDSEDDDGGDGAVSTHAMNRMSVVSKQNKALTFAHASMDNLTQIENEYKHLVGGESNCFTIELHAMHDEVDSRQVVDLLQATFEVHPEREYCLLSAPSAQSHTPLLAHFVRITAKRPFIFEPHSSLYVLQRNALFSAIYVRPMHPTEDHKRVQKFVESMVHGPLISAILKNLAPRSNESAFVIEMEGEIIGVCRTEPCDHIHVLLLDYDVRGFLMKDSYNKPGEASVLQMLLLQPAFTMRSPFIFSEMLRLLKCNVMFFKLHHNTQINLKELPPINTLLSEMRPMKPRNRMRYDTDRLRPEQLPPAYVLQPPADHSRFALYAQTGTSAALRKLHVNARLVLVGCSQTALAFLEELLFAERSRDIWFTRITLISPMGLDGAEADDLSALASAFEPECLYRPEYVRRLGLGTWVNTVHGMVTGIHRALQYVLVDGRKRVYYDRLYMFSGLQFDYPVRVKQMPLKQPRNVMFVNNAQEADELLAFVRKLVEEQATEDYGIIVYGDNVDSYACLSMLIKSGVPTSRITFVRPRTLSVSTSVDTFNDRYVSEVMGQTLEYNGIYVLENCDLTDWKLDKASGGVTKVNVESDLQIFELPCTLFVCFERKNVNRSTIIAINDAGLVFDGRLVIDDHYQTSDALIFAAGPMTKFKRQLYADEYRHEFVCSQEVGARMAGMTLDALSPVRTTATAPLPFISDAVQVYRKAFVIHRPVIGDMYFTCVRAPTRPVPYDLAKALPTYGPEFVTGMEAQRSPQTPMRYCRIHLNEFNLIETLVCLTNEELNIFKYKELWGKHESAFSNLKLRFEQHSITDLHEYFKRPWIYLLVHDSFTTRLRATNKRTVLAILRDDPGLLSFCRDTIVQNKWQKMDEKQRLQFAEEFITSSYDCRTNTNNIDFIVEYIDELPMYFDPKQTTIVFTHE